ncbi:hypothetical protein BD777DRAFT_167788 [Yarrowia lipolytica]|nr:hypothetical protein BKA90DRAFT_159800 [Yarrowia lipolytica]RMI98902.1 hypothetical protein BD777DRAFT_167788 [Yarrowia lipolytica]
MIHSLLSLASLALAQDADVVEQTGSDVLEILLDFGLDVATAASTHPGDFFEFVLDGDIETSAYNFEVVDSSGTPIFDIVNVDNSLTFRATATDYFLENTQALEGQIEGATFSFGYTLGEGLGFPSDSEPVQITYVDITRSDLGMPNIQVQDLSLVSPSSISVTIANVPGALSILFCGFRSAVAVAEEVETSTTSAATSAEETCTTFADETSTTFADETSTTFAEETSTTRPPLRPLKRAATGADSTSGTVEESASVSSQSAASAEASATASSEIVPISGFSSATSIAGNLSSASDLADVTEIVSTTITTTQTATYCKDGTCGNTVVVLTTCVPVHHTVTTCPTVIEGKTLTVLVPCEIETGDAVTTTEIVLKPTETVSKPIKTVAKATETVSKPIKAGTTTVVTILDSSSIMPVPVSTVTGTIVTLTSARPIVPQVDSVPSVVPQANAGSKLTFGPLALLPFLMV